MTAPRSASIPWQEAWSNRFYRSRSGWQDGTTEFHGICKQIVPPGGQILEIGAGPTNPTSALLSSLGEVHGVDISEEVRGNVHLASAAVVGPRDRYPFPDASFDVAISDYVVEHVDDPATHLREIARVLKPGGRYAFRTPNLFHYVAAVSRLTPHRVHTLISNRLRNHDASVHEPWPTVYAMNTPGAVRRFAKRLGFEVETLRMVEKDPSYGMSARPLFLAFMAYERVVNATERLAPFRANMFVVLRKA